MKFYLFILIIFTSTSLFKGNKLNENKPNIIILLADDVGYGDIGFTGHSIYNTTNLNILSHKGTVFTQLYSPTPLCTPSRAGLLTGRHPVRMGMAGNYSEDPMFGTEGVLECDASKGLPYNEKTIAQYLNETGYNTYLVGKWHLGHRCEYLPHVFGFKEFLGVPYAVSMGSFSDTKCTGALSLFCPPMPLMHSSRDIDKEDVCRIVDQPAKKENLTDIFIDKIRENLDESKETSKPFFIFMSFANAHVDCEGKAFSSKPEFLEEDFYYKASIEEMDYMSGKIYNLLQERNLTNNTIIYFTSDNGAYTIQKKSLAKHGRGSTGPFTGSYSAIQYNNFDTGKCSTWEGGMRVPGFFIWEGNNLIKPGGVSRQVFSLMDFLPTILNILDIPTPSNLDGINMLPSLYEKAYAKRFIHFYRGGSLYAIRYGRWKFHLFTRPADECGKPWWRISHIYGPVEHKTFLIFDLDQDQNERFGIYGEDFEKQYPIVYKEVLEELKNHRESMKNITANLLGDFDPEFIVCCDREKNCNCST